MLRRRLSSDRRCYTAAPLQKNISKPCFLQFWCQPFIKSLWLNTGKSRAIFSSSVLYGTQTVHRRQPEKHVSVIGSIDTPPPLPLRTRHGYYFSLAAIFTRVVLIPRLLEHLWCKDMKDEGRRQKEGGSHPPSVWPGFRGWDVKLHSGIMFSKLKISGACSWKLWKWSCS